MTASTIGHLVVEVSNNGKDFSSDGITFEAHKMLRIDKVVPSVGTMQGSASVVVHLSQEVGSSLAGLSCRFGQNFASATTSGTSTSREVTCKVPSAVSRGIAPLSVYDGGRELTEEIDFSYVPIPEVTEVVPRRGPLSGNTVLRILGKGFTETLMNAFECRLGSKAVRGSLVSASEALCVTPAQEAVGAVPLEISSTGGDGFQTMDTVFDYDMPVVVFAVFPSQVSATTGVQVTVIGENFRPSLELACKFGRNTIVRGAFFSSSQIECPAPRMKPANSSLEVSNNGVDFSPNGLTFKYISSAALVGIVPSQGPMLGSTTVTVTMNQALTGYQMHCRFDDVHSPALHIDGAFLAGRWT